MKRSIDSKKLDTLFHLTVPWAWIQYCTGFMTFNFHLYLSDFSRNLKMPNPLLHKGFGIFEVFIFF
ncbi:hypothetical protein Bmyc01_48860 [Bacillus mycoides]|nr:hypothetical protein Bmyc01_48860 [Bacillus mycoides]